MTRPIPPTADEADDEAAGDPHAWQAQREALGRLHREVLAEPIPPALLAAAGLASQRQARHARWTRWGGMAAGVLLAFGAGWLAHGRWPASSDGARLAGAGAAAREFVHAASVAHAVYAPEKRHPVEVAAAEQQHLLQWLSKRLDKPLQLPDLSSQGYTLVGGRLLPGDRGARAQFMFENAAGERVTLYIGTLDAGSSAPPADASRETAFRFSSEGSVPSFYWVDRGFGYAIAGALPRAALLNLATLVYRQLAQA